MGEVSINSGDIPASVRAAPALYAPLVVAGNRVANDAFTQEIARVFKEEWNHFFNNSSPYVGKWEEVSSTAKTVRIGTVVKMSGSSLGFTTGAEFVSENRYPFSYRPNRPEIIILASEVEEKGQTVAEGAVHELTHRAQVVNLLGDTRQLDSDARAEIIPPPEKGMLYNWDKWNSKKRLDWLIGRTKRALRESGYKRKIIRAVSSTPEWKSWLDQLAGTQDYNAVHDGLWKNIQNPKFIVSHYLPDITRLGAKGQMGIAVAGNLSTYDPKEPVNGWDAHFIEQQAEDVVEKFKGEVGRPSFGKGLKVWAANSDTLASLRSSASLGLPVIFLAIDVNNTATVLTSDNVSPDLAAFQGGVVLSSGASAVYSVKMVKEFRQYGFKMIEASKRGEAIIKSIPLATNDIARVAELGRWAGIFGIAAGALATEVDLLTTFRNPEASKAEKGLAVTNSVLSVASAIILFSPQSAFIFIPASLMIHSAKADAGKRRQAAQLLKSIGDRTEFAARLESADDDVVAEFIDQAIEESPAVLFKVSTDALSQMRAKLNHGLFRSYKHLLITSALLDDHDETRRLIEAAGIVDIMQAWQGLKEIDQNLAENLLQGAAWKFSEGSNIQQPMLSLFGPSQ